jgi:protease-4
MQEEDQPSAQSNLATLLVWLVLPLLLGILVSSAIPQPIIGVIRLNDAIFSSTAEELVAQIEYARTHPEIRAVVLILDSPGGTVVDTETVYLELIKLQGTIPVVTYVQGLAASGAYYLSVATNHILSGPSSLIGNVGVISSLPPDPYILEDIATTGPYKMFGSARDAVLREMEIIKQGFYQAVTLGRGDRLRIGPDVLLSAQIWPASEALRLGLIDGLSSQTDALDVAAHMAMIRHYRVVDLEDLAAVDEPGAAPFFMETEEGLLTPYPKKPGVYLLYIPGADRRLP